MTSIKELLDDAIRYEERLLAYHIFSLIQSKKISLTDDAAELKKHKPVSNLKQLADQNILGICPIKIYSLKQNEKRFIFIFAKSPKDARELYYREYRREPLNCMELSPDEVMDYGNRFMTFREIKKEMQTFPCILGYFDKPNLTVRR